MRRFLFTAMLLAAPLAAQPSAPRIYCPATCFAIKYEFTPYSVSQPNWFATNFTVWLQNLEGTYGPSAGPSQLNTFWLARNNGPVGPPNGRPSEVLWVSTAQNNFLVADGDAQTGEWVWSDRFDCASDECTNALFAFSGQGVAGCSEYPNGLPGQYAVRTCPRDGLNGWARMDFTMWLESGTNLGEARGVTFADFGLGIGGPFQANSCGFDETGSNCASVPYTDLPPSQCVLDGGGQFDCFGIVPEPATYWLMLTGLGVIGMLRRRYRVG